AAVIDHHGERLRLCLPDVEDKLDKLQDRIDALSSSYETLVAEDVNPTEVGQKYMTKTAIETTVTFLRDWKH
ncbi:MAG: hypothetical protein RLO21_16335, partial [Nitratireductor sp.]